MISRKNPLDFLNRFSSIGGRVLSHYAIGPPIGGGTMGQVYRALDTRLGRPVAIKVLHHWARGDARARERLRQEARAASALSHPNIVTIHDIDEEGGVDLLVMEYLEGKTLADFIPSRGLPVLRVLKIAIQIADALTAAHHANILHRDIKPSNMMVLTGERVKVLDFGLAAPLTMVSGDAMGPSEQPGTKVYMAPEQLKGTPATPRSEIFSLGVVLHQMLGGKHPFGSADPTHSSVRAQIIEAISDRDPLPLPPKVPRDLAQIIKRCLSKDPDERFSGMEQVLKALCDSKDSLEGKPLRTSGSHSFGRTPPPTRDIREIIKRIRHDNVFRSRKALGELAGLIKKGLSPAATNTVIEALRNVILTLDDFGGRGVPDAVREIRGEVLEALKLAAPGRLGEQFEARDLETLDLYAMDFSHEVLRGLSFRRCFLIESRFRESDLTGASFGRAFIRNVDFTGATLEQVDFSDTDWFNALGLTAGQLERARQDTVRECPSDITGMHAILGARYGYSFDAWTNDVQRQLRMAWDEYLRPGGLRDLVADWRRSTR